MALGLTQTSKNSLISFNDCSCCFDLQLGYVQGFAAIVEPSFQKGILNFFTHLIGPFSPSTNYANCAGYSGEIFLMQLNQNGNNIIGIANVLISVPRSQDETNQANWFMLNHPRTGTFKIKLIQSFDTNKIEFFSSDDDGLTWIKQSFSKNGDYLTAIFSTNLFQDIENIAFVVRIHLIIPKQSLIMPFNISSNYINSTYYFSLTDNNGCFSGTYLWPPVSNSINLICNNTSYEEVFAFINRYQWNTFSYFFIFPEIIVEKPNSDSYFFYPDLREPVLQLWDGSLYFYRIKISAFKRIYPTFDAVYYGTGDLTITL